MIKKLPCYELAAIKLDASNKAQSFRIILASLEENRLSFVREFLAKYENTVLPYIDDHWMTLCENELQELLDWVNRLESVRHTLDLLHVLLARASISHDLDEAAFDHMGFLEAFRSAAGRVIEASQISSDDIRT